MSQHDSGDELPELSPARVSLDAKRPHSIDLSLELERQLDNESLPPTPAFAKQQRPQSLDPHVLASIVTQLRLNLDEVTKEKNELAHLYTEAHASQVELKSTLAHVSERCIGLESDLAAAVEKQKEDADAVTMLRGKLEDSRRALMRLQTESRRMSQVSNLTIDSSRAAQSPYSPLGSGKRSSFAPLTGSPAARGNAHRRIVSVSDSGLMMSPSPTGEFLNGPSSPPRIMSQDIPPTRRMSSFFGRAHLALDLPVAADASEVEELHKELETVKEQLEETRHELTESQEAREASETCVNALRTFISEHSIGLGPAATAARPALANQDSASNPASKWSFKLWKSESAPAGSAPAQLVSPVTPMLPTPAPTPGASSTSSRFGGFFSSRASVSSTSSSRLESHHTPHSGQQEPMCNGSDSSSVDDLVTEPISPASEAPRLNILVRDNDESSEQLSYAVMAQAEGMKKLEVVTSSISDDYMPIVR